ncbi:Hypothetical protein POVN_LOCUS90 [uncultured virus]|nr:Hypothetical protein POVN_LOCUS90 [uncultured virus]
MTDTGLKVTESKGVAVSTLEQALVKVVPILGVPTTQFDTRYFIKYCIRIYDIPMADMAQSLGVDRDRFITWVNRCSTIRSKLTPVIMTWITDHTKQLKMDSAQEQKKVAVRVRFSRRSDVTAVTVMVPVGDRVMDLVERIVGTGVMSGVTYADIDSIRFKGKTIDWSSDVAKLVATSSDVFKLVVYHSFWHPT